MRRLLTVQAVLLALLAAIAMPIFGAKPVSAEEAVVEVTIVEPTDESTEETEITVPNTGAKQLFGREFSAQDLTTLAVASIMIIACGITAIFSYKTHKQGGKNE